MSVKKFINDVKESLGLGEFKKSNKKKSLEKLLKQLKKKKDEIKNSDDKDNLKDELKIINIQIKTGEDILEKLSA